MKAHNQQFFAQVEEDPNNYYSALSGVIDLKAVDTLYKLDKYCWEQKLGEDNWFIFNLLNFNYMITDEPFSSLRIASTEKEIIKHFLDLGFLDYYPEEILFENQRNEWENHIRSEYNQKFEDITIRIIPTYNCNFRCSYCYQPSLTNEESRDNQKYISMNQTKELFNIITKKIDFNSQKLSMQIAGGEAFLNKKVAFDFIKLLSHNAKKLGIRLIFITNGYNINLFLPLIKDCKDVRYDITLDGLEDVHNNRRYLINKGSTFTRIISNIEKILDETNHSVKIRINVDKKNIDSLHLFFEYLNDKGWLNSSRISLAIRVVVIYYNNNTREFPVGKNTLHYSSNSKIIKLILKYKLKTASIDGQILPTVLYELFMPKLLGNNTDAFDSIGVDILCDANQGFFGLADFNGFLRSCGFELAPLCGNYYPSFQLDEKKIKEWNSKDFILKKFNHTLCINCKFFFICNMRQCTFSDFITYDKEEEICSDKKYTVTEFFKCFAHLF